MHIPDMGVAFLVSGTVGGLVGFFCGTLRAQERYLGTVLKFCEGAPVMESLVDALEYVRAGLKSHRWAWDGDYIQRIDDALAAVGERP